MLKKLLLFFLLITFSSFLFAQDSKEDIQQKQKDLQKELIDLNNTLASIKKNKKQSLGQLALVQKKIQARQQLINSLGKQMRNIDEDIYVNEVTINHLRLELDTLKNQYAQSLVFAYKNRSNYDYLNFLFSASSFNDAVKRITYLKSYRRLRETQVDDINKTQNLLQQKIGTLNTSKAEKNNTIKQQGSQLQNLEADKKEQDDVVKNLKSQEKDVAAQIKTKEKARQKLQQSLQTIIRREIAAAKERDRLAAIEKQKEIDKQKAANPTQPTANNTTPANNTTTNARKERTYSALESTQEGLNESISFENGRGRLPWPVDAGNVTSPFGEHAIPGTKLHEDNPGIDISLPVGASVKSVADGTVSSVFDIGGGDESVVIRHGKYFTTYSNLSSVNVGKGDNVKPGTVIGHAGTGDDGQGQITFMVSNEKGINLDPESWLRSR